MKIERLAVLGPGLLGGSILLRVARRYPGVILNVWGRREAALDPVRELGVARVVSTNIETVVDQAQVLVLCTPIGAMAEIARKILPRLAEDAVVTDVGSVKSCVVAELEQILSGRFVGAHPMAGAECDGFLAAREDLYENALCILTPGPAAANDAVRVVEEFWGMLGCRTAHLSPRVHDEIIARVSHLPHLLASCLVMTAVSAAPGDLEFAGPGFRDSTRIARGPVDMWTEILMSNREALMPEVDRLAEILAKARESLASGESRGINEILERARAALIHSRGKILTDG